MYLPCSSPLVSGPFGTADGFGMELDLIEVSLTILLVIDTVVETLVPYTSLLPIVKPSL